MRNETDNSNKAKVETKSAETTSVDDQEYEPFLSMESPINNSAGLFNSENKLGLEQEREDTIADRDKKGFFTLTPFHKTN
ncbi:hypothetical protein [Coxiella burnetii]|uniref:hypothetical protein n=1 Tax=Coxiella burnetii TaxID=777 RepID=UPI002230087F|nr:hypothetical protein [Coxiella burnetii]